MRPFVACVALLFATLGTAATAFAEMAENLTVVVDRALILPAPAGTSTLVVGNPAIADTSIQKNNVIVLTGKSYGTTNIVAIDSSGKTIKEMLVTVRSPDDKIITVHRGVERESYSCTPKCEQTLRLGDSAQYFGQVGAQSTTRNGFAQQAQGTPGR